MTSMSSGSRIFSKNSYLNSVPSYYRTSGRPNFALGDIEDQGEKGMHVMKHKTKFVDLLLTGFVLIYRFPYYQVRESHTFPGMTEEKHHLFFLFGSAKFQIDHTTSKK